MPLISVAAPSLVAGVSGESENRIRDLFTQVKVSTNTQKVEFISTFVLNETVSVIFVYRK